MQTFLPYERFALSAQCLDYKRLGKQRLEALQILECNLGIRNNAWKNHPIVKMWRGYELALSYYGIEICTEWIRRGYKDNLLDVFSGYWIKLCSGETRLFFPWWIGVKQFHTSHKSQLLNKNYEHYSKFNWDVKEIGLPYLWATEKENVFWYSVDGKHKVYLEV